MVHTYLGICIAWFSHSIGFSEIDYCHLRYKSMPCTKSIGISWEFAFAKLFFFEYSAVLARADGSTVDGSGKAKVGKRVN